MSVESNHRRGQRHLATIAMIVASLLLAGCATIDPGLEFIPDSQITGRIIAQQEDLFPDIDPLAINDDIVSIIEGRIGTGGPDRERLVKLQNLLFGSDGLNLQYDEQQTQTAIEVFRSGAGNCLSVMNLYVAAARHLGIDASFQTAKVRPEWDRRGNLVVLSDHINATGELSPFVDYVVDFTPDLALQQSSLQTVSDRQARALYFNNLGVEALIAQDDSKAMAYLRNALWLQPELAIAWNNMGTALNRSGQSELAEYSYQMSIHLEPNSATAIGNLARLYEASGANGEAARLRRFIAEFNRVNPYYQFELGNFAFEDGQFDEAIRYYRRAIKLDEHEPVFYVALANVYEQRGETLNQRKMLETAGQMLEESQFVYVPSNQKLRIRDSRTILNDASAATRIAVDR